jgi:hypothetical protein
MGRGSKSVSERFYWFVRCVRMVAFFVVSLRSIHVFLCFVGKSFSASWMCVDVCECVDLCGFVVDLCGCVVDVFGCVWMCVCLCVVCVWCSSLNVCPHVQRWTCVHVCMCVCVGQFAQCLPTRTALEERACVWHPHRPLRSA